MTFRVYFRTGFPGSDWYFTTSISKGELPTPLGSMAVGFKQMAFDYLRYTGNPNNPVDGGLGLIGVRIDPSNRNKIIGIYELTKKSHNDLDKRGTFIGMRK